MQNLVSAVLGGSTSIAGLLLVFSGFLFSQAANFPPETTDEKIIQRYRRAAKFGLIPFALAILTAGLAALWLFSPFACLGYAVAAMFAVLLLGTAIYGGVTIMLYL